AFSIIKLCDGTNTKNDIIKKLSLLYNEELNIVKNMVESFIEQLNTGGILNTTSTKNRRVVEVRGSKNYFVPELVILELTHKCPLKCKHCYVNAGNGPSMDFELLMKTAKKMVKQGVQGFQLTGGEPFAYRNIEAIVDYLYEQKVRTQITTSGFYLNETVKRCVKKIASVGGLIQISVDGFSETHNRIRGNENAFENAIKLIDYAKMNNVTVVVATCIVDQNLKGIEKLSIFLSEKQIDLHRIGGVSYQGRAEKNSLHTSVSFSDINKFIQYLKESYETMRFKISGFEEISTDSDYNCGAGYKIIKVSPEFIVSPCPMMNVNIGNIKQEK
ncbi:radical SAM protein, partial [Bacillus clarus]